MTTEERKKAALDFVSKRIADLDDEIRIMQESGCGGWSEYQDELEIFNTILELLSPTPDLGVAVEALRNIEALIFKDMEPNSAMVAINGIVKQALKSLGGE